MGSHKEVHVAENLTDLEKIAIDDQLELALKSKSFNTLCTLEKKIYQEILNELYDEELAYIYCFRHQYIMKRIKTIDEKFAANRYTQENERVKERLRQLRESLKIRYQNLRRVAVRVEDKETEVSIEDSAIMFMNSFISPKDLYVAMKKYKDLLLLDIRTTEEFLTSKIKYENIINIPYSLISKGLSANKLGDLLSESDRMIWNQRDRYRALIIVDYTIRDVNSDDEPFSILRSVIVNWDINRSYNEHPVILEGGFKDFAEMYPTEVENGYLLKRFKYIELDEIMEDMKDLNVVDLFKDIKRISSSSSLLYQKPDEFESGDSESNASMRALHSGTSLTTDSESNDSMKVVHSGTRLSSISSGSLATPRECPVPTPFPGRLEDFYSDININRSSSSSSDIIPRETSPTPTPYTVPRLEDLYSEFNVTRTSSGNLEFASGTSSTSTVYYEPAAFDQPSTSRGLTSSSYNQPSTSMSRKTDVDPLKFDENSSESSTDEDKELRNKNILDYQKKMEQKLNIDLNLKRKLKPQVDKTISKPFVDRETKPVMQKSVVKKPIYGLVGMKNVRNNCYMNACIQALRCIPLIKAFFMSDLSKNMIENRSTILLSSLVAVTRILWGFSGRIFDPSSFRDRMVQIRPQYRSGEHEDSTEFLLLVLDKLEIDTSCQFPEKYKDTPRQIIYQMKRHMWSVFTDLFYYLIRNDKICSNCKAVSTSYECENTIMVPVPEISCSIYEVLKNYFQTTSIQGYKCEKCHHTVTAAISKTMDVMPKILVIALKRYVQIGSTCVKSKIFIDVPESTMDLYGSTYELQAIICHKGSLEIGHYYTVAKMFDSWYEANDDYVHSAKSMISDEFRSECTVFFFQLKSNGKN